MTRDERAERRARVAELTDKGKSQQQIADELDITRDAVRRDQKATGRTPGRTTAPGDAPGANARAPHPAAPAPPGRTAETPGRPTPAPGAPEPSGPAEVVRPTETARAETGPPGRTVTIEVDDELGAAFASLSRAGCTPQEAVRFAVTRLATGYRRAVRTGRLPEGPFEVARIALEPAVAEEDVVPLPPGHRYIDPHPALVELAAAARAAAVTDTARWLPAAQHPHLVRALSDTITACRRAHGDQQDRAVLVAQFRDQGARLLEVADPVAARVNARVKARAGGGGSAL